MVEVTGFYEGVGGGITSASSGCYVCSCGDCGCPSVCSCTCCGDTGTIAGWRNSDDTQTNTSDSVGLNESYAVEAIES